MTDITSTPDLIAFPGGLRLTARQLWQRATHPVVKHNRNLKKLLRVLALSACLLLVCSEPATAQDLITNGSFENPAHTGNGDIFSTSNTFSLPGWTCPTGTNQFFLEYGTPMNSRRYLDGRQAVCLNGLGTPVSMSQTFATMAGQNYILTFGQSDAMNAGPSLSQLTVTVAGQSRVFSRSNDTGYVVKNWHFTASSNLTTVQFTDTTPPLTPGDVHPLISRPPSPFVDSVCVNPGAILVAGTATAIPGGSGSFSSFPGEPALGGTTVAFFATGPASQQGIYSFPGNPTFPGAPVRIADLNTTIPNGSGNFATFGGTAGFPGNPTLGGGYVAFWGADSSGQQGIYSGFPGNPLKVVADTATAIPGGTGSFTQFAGNDTFPGEPTISGQRVAFFGAGSAGQQGIYSFPGEPTFPGSPAKIADLNTAIPGGTGNFTTFTTSAGFPSQPLLSGNNAIFWAGGASGQQGIYLFPGNPTFPGTPVKIVDLNTAMPGGTGNFTNFPGNPSFPTEPVISGNNVAFRGSGAGGRIGVYASIAGTLVKVADTTTAIPGGNGLFTDFKAVTLSGDVVVFAATGNGGQSGIYASFPTNPGVPANPIYPGEPTKVIDLLDTLDGKAITGLQLGPAGLSGDPLAFVAALSDASQGIYTVPVMAEVSITSVAQTGGDLQLSYTAPAGYNYSVQSRTDLVGGAWSSLGVTNPGNGAIQQMIVTNPFAEPRQFYRVQQGR